MKYELTIRGEIINPSTIHWQKIEKIKEVIHLPTEIEQCLAFADIFDLPNENLISVAFAKKKVLDSFKSISKVNLFKIGREIFYIPKMDIDKLCFGDACSLIYYEQIRPLIGGQATILQMATVCVSNKRPLKNKEQEIKRKIAIFEKHLTAQQFFSFTYYKEFVTFALNHFVLQYIYKTPYQTNTDKVPQNLKDRAEVHRNVFGIMTALYIVAETGVFHSSNGKTALDNTINVNVIHGFSYFFEKTMRG